MLTKDVFYRCIDKLCRAYRIKKEHKSYPDEEDLDFLMELLNSQGMNDSLFSKACFKMALGAEKGNTFTLPMAGDFLNIAGLSVNNPEEEAERQAELVYGNLQSCLGMPLVQFENPVTNYTVTHNCGGISRLCYEYADPFNDNKKDPKWARKDFVNMWMSNFERGNEQNHPCKSSSAVPTGRIVNIGNEQACVEMLEKSKMQIEHNKNENSKAADDITKLLAKNMKA